MDELLQTFENNKEVDQDSFKTLLLLIEKWGTPSKYPGVFTFSCFEVIYPSSNPRMLETVNNDVWSNEDECIFYICKERVSYRTSTNDLAGFDLVEKVFY